jgi:hypothetical protein
MTRKYEEDKAAGWEFLAALFPVRVLGGDKGPASVTTEPRRPILMGDPATAAVRKLFLEALLDVQWLPSTVRRAVMAELGRSLQEQNAGIERAEAATLRVMINEEEARMRANGERPRGGVGTAAIAVVAASQGLKVETLLKKLYRLDHPDQRPRKRRRQR